MVKSITDFIEEYVDGEPLTNKSVAWAIKKYIYMNYEPTKQDKLDMYEALLKDIATAYDYESDNFDPLAHEKLITNILNWDYARNNKLENEAEQIALENETFYNLRKL